MQQSNDWQWRLGQTQVEGWQLRHEQWKKIVAKPRADFSQLNRRWRTNLADQQWIRIWKKVWGSPTFERDKVLIWRVLNHGLFHNRRARIWGMNDRLYPRWRTHTESIEHMLFGCKSAHRRWVAIGVRLVGTCLAPTFMKLGLIRGTVVFGYHKSTTEPYHICYYY